MKNILLLLLYICSLSSVVHAQRTSLLNTQPKSRGALAFPYFQKLNQPDNSEVNLIIKGDGVIHWFETTEGEKVLRDAKGWFTYAIIDDRGYMVPSNIRVQTGENKYQQIISNTKKDVFFSKKQLREKERTYYDYSANQSDKYKVRGLPYVQFPSIGIGKNLMILAEFSDTPHVIDASVFNNIMNKSNYTPSFNKLNSHTGSFRDFYLENSYNQLDCRTDIVSENNNGIDFIWIKLPQTLEYYGSNDSSGNDENAVQMIIDAVKAADLKGVDFSKYDNDDDGDVDNIMVIHSGYGEEAGAPEETIWSHKFNLGGKALTIDGKTVSAYITFPELSFASGSVVTSIGVLVHEFGHALGLPDYYDTDFNGGGIEAPGLGYWDVMSAGSYNNRGVTPAHHNAYSKHLLGWIDLVELKDVSVSEKEQIEISNLAENNQNVAFMIKTKIDEEFFVLENRQQKNFDSNIPANGMLVYHVDRNYGGDTWTTNEVNADPDHQCMELLFAGKDNVDSESTPFPGSKQIVTLSDDTGKQKGSYNTGDIKLANDPCFLTWSLENSFAHINSIRLDNGVIKFDFYTSIDNNLYVDVVFKYNEMPVDINYEGDKIVLTSIISDENTVQKTYISFLDKFGRSTIKDVIKADYNIIIESNNKKFIYNNKEVIASFDTNYSATVESNNLSISLRLADIEDDNLRIFPNPTKGYVQIETSLKEKAILRVYDMKGALVLEKELFAVDLDNKSLHGLDLSVLNSGVYNLILIDGDKKSIKRIIKE